MEEPIESRQLSPEEASLLRWMLKNGQPEAARYVDVVDSLRVSSWRCPCGCASLEFVTRDAKSTHGMQPIADFVFGSDDHLCDIFVYLVGDGELGGIEVSGYGCEAPKKLPEPSQLRRANAP